jgi:hypothetical protein
MGPDPANPETFADARPLDPSLRLEPVPYQPEGGFRPFGVLVVFLCVTLAGLGLGYAVSWVGQWIYIILVFPFLLGILVGFFGAVGIYVGSVRNLFLAGLAGLFGGCLTLFAMHYFDYERDMARPRQDKAGQVPNAGAAPAKPADRQPDFWGYLDRQARKGIPIQFRRLHFTLGYVATYLYWLVEVAIVSGLAMAILIGCASDPFCAECSTWKSKQALGTLALAPDQALRIFSAGEIVRLADQEPAAGEIHLTIWSCPNCAAEAPVDVKLEQVTKNAKNEEETRPLTFLTYPGQVLPVLESLFAPEATEEAE